MRAGAYSVMNKGSIVATGLLTILLPIAAWAQSSQQSAPPTTEAANQFGSPCPYPDLARAANIEGNTLIAYRGTYDGRIEDVKVVHTSGNDDLDDATVQCVSRWRFDPSSPSAKFNLGKHATTIMWVIPKTRPGAPRQMAFGLFAGLMHTCENYYPRAEFRSRTEGTTKLSFHISIEGLPKDMTIAQSSGNDDLDNAALECASHWRYRPALKNGVPIETPWDANVVWRVPPENTAPAPSN